MALNLDVTKLTDKQLRESCRCADSGGDCEFCIEQFHRDEDREHANLETPRRTFAKPAQTVAEFKRGEPRTQIDQLNNQYSLYRDGRLISVQHFDTLAAAPELLEALDRAVEVMQFAYMNAPQQPPEIAQALAALLKARGGV